MGKSDHQFSRGDLVKQRGADDYGYVVRIVTVDNETVLWCIWHVDRELCFRIGRQCEHLFDVGSDELEDYITHYFTGALYAHIRLDHIEQKRYPPTECVCPELWRNQHRSGCNWLAWWRKEKRRRKNK